MKKQVYFDNAATTSLDEAVLNEMMPYLQNHFGNPSSTHSFGRITKGAIEKARRTVAKQINAKPAEITFTSGGTEADNMALHCAVKDLGVKRIITSKVEHHAILHTAQHIGEDFNVKVEFVNLLHCGSVDLGHLEELLNDTTPTLVSLMHGNNEVGVLLPLEKVAKLVKSKGAYFHSDTVQTVGHIPIDLAQIPADFITCGAHKLHGPKGVGFLFTRTGIKSTPLLCGGAQEREKRGGTENLYGIVGLAKAVEVACTEMEEHAMQIKSVRAYMVEQLKANIPGVQFNSPLEGDFLYTVLNVNFPVTEKAQMILFLLDLEGIACSGGSACSSGSNKGSHVLQEIEKKNEGPNIRFSFSKYNTKEDVDYVVDVLKKFF